MALRTRGTSDDTAREHAAYPALNSTGHKFIFNPFEDVVIVVAIFAASDIRSRLRGVGRFPMAGIAFSPCFTRDTQLRRSDKNWRRTRNHSCSRLDAK